MYLWKLPNKRAFLAAALLAASVGAGAHPGDLDTRFGAMGTAKFAVPDLVPGALPMVVDHDNRIIYASATSSGGVLGALAANGAVDLSFGASGLVPLTTEILDLRIDSHNRIVALSSDYTGIGYIGFEALRFNADGTPDTSFGIGGASVIGIDDNLVPAALTLDADDNVFITGTEPFAASGDSLMLVAKLDSSGLPDLRFGSSGIETLPLLPPGTENSTSAAIAVDGSDIYVAGFTYAVPGRADGVLVKLVAKGVLDPAFGSGGFVVTDAFPGLSASRYTFPTSMMVDTRGNIIVAGGAGDGMGSSFAMAMRFLPSGALDSTFNAGQPVSVGSDLYQQGVTESVFFDARGKIVLSNYVQHNPLTSVTCAVARLNDDGSVDRGFAAATDCGAGTGWHGALTQSGDVVVYGATIDDSALTWTSYSSYDMPTLPHGGHP